MVVSARGIFYLVGLLAALFANGCQIPPPHCHPVMPLPATEAGPVPREHSKAVLPDYVIEPPDILTIDAVNRVPLAPYRLSTFDSLILQVKGTFEESPISGEYRIEPGGMLNLGAPYGAVKVSGMTMDEARAAIERHLRVTLKDPEVSALLGQTARVQPIAGEHLVAPDGKVNLGMYGRVSVVGKTVEQA
jgi:polysaccharide export outer membrane protein